MKTRSKRRFRWQLWLAAFVVLLIAGYFLAAYLMKKEPLPATTFIKRGDLESSVLATGTLRPKNLVAIGAQATGRVLSLNVRPGQHVKAGDVVALIDSTKQKNEFDKSQATLRQKEANRTQNLAELELAKQELARSQIMIGKNAVARADYDKAVAAVKSKEAQVAYSDAAIAASEVDVRIAENNLTYTRITAPIDGTILMTVVQEGQTLNAEQSAPTIAIIGQLDTMLVEADISESDVAQVREGMPLYFTLSGQNQKRYDAKLEKIEPAPDSIVNDKSVAGTSAAAPVEKAASAIYYKGIFSVQNPGGLLRTYMTTEVHIVLASVRDVVLAPVSALLNLKEPNKAMLKVVTAGDVIAERTVKTGVTDKINTEIISGLNEGDRVITDNQAEPSAAVGL